VTAPGTVTKAMALLNRVAERPGRTLTELAKDADLPAPTAHRLLRALLGEGLVRMDPSNRYHLGSHCLYLGTRFLDDVDLRSEAEPHLQALVDDTGETAHLGVADGVDVVYLAKVDSPHAVRMFSRIGGRMPMYCTAMGKAMLAFSDAAAVQRVIDGGLAPRTPNTITTPARLTEELARTRERGWSIDDIENEDGIRCVAAPILVDDQRPVGAISVSAPEGRLSHDRVGEVADAVRTAADRVAAALGYQGGVDDE
jgi:DNA-binding IclR family transcriptional regulator